MAPLVVGISGPSRAGKGSLVRNLLQYLVPKQAKEEKSQDSCGNDASRGVLRYALPDGSRVSVINQDWYFMHDKIRTELHGIYETPDALDNDAVLVALQTEREITGMRYVLFEGFLAFHDDRVMPLLDWKLWIDVPRHLVFQRRTKTKYVKKTYFDTVLWPAHESYTTLVFGSRRRSEMGAIHCIDGTLPMKAVFRSAVTLLNLPPREGGMDQRASNAACQQPTQPASAEVSWCSRSFVSGSGNGFPLGGGRFEPLCSPAQLSELRPRGSIRKVWNVHGLGHGSMRFPTTHPPSFGPVLDSRQSQNRNVALMPYPDGAPKTH